MAGDSTVEGSTPAVGYPHDESANEAAVGGPAAGIAAIAAGVAGGASEKEAIKDAEQQV